MMLGNIYGRLGNTPAERLTRSGKPMATASVAVDVTGQAGEDAGEQETLWVSVLAFGSQCDILLSAKKGQMVAAIGKLTRGRYITREGIERESWTLLAESVITPKATRAGGSRTDPPPNQRPPPPDFDDEIPF